MTRSSKGPLGDGPSLGSRTGFAGDVSAVSVGKCSMAAQTSSSLKAHVVNLLSRLFEINPARAIAWAHVVQARFSWFPGA